MKTRKSLCFVLNSLGSGGAERVAITLMNTAIELGIDVTCVVTFTSSDLAEPYAINPCVKLYRLRQYGNLNSAGKVLYLRRFFRRNKFDHIISFLTNVNLLVIFSLIGTSKLNVLTISERIDKGKERLSILYTVPRFFCYRLSRNLVVQNEYNRKSYRYFHSSIHVISNPFGLDIEQFSKYRRDYLRGEVVIMVGRLTSQKGYENALNILSNYSKTCRVFIHGEGPDEEILRRSIVRYGLVNCSIDGLSDRIEEVYAKGDILFHNARYEGFPNVVLEAAVLGLSCVVFDSGDGVRLLAKHFKNIYLFNSDLEAIELLRKVRNNHRIETKSVNSHPFDRFEILQQWLKLL